MCELCLGFGTTSEIGLTTRSWSAEEVEPGDGAGAPGLNGAGAVGAPLETLPSDRLYAVATAVASTAMDRLVPSSNLAAARNFTYQFEVASPADMPAAYSAYTLTPYTDQQKTIVRSIFADIQTLTNLTFTETVGAADADISLMRGNLESSYGGRGRFVYSYSTIGGQQTVTNYDGFAIFNQTRSLTTANDLTLMYHEIGHALTLRHPGNVDINPANAPPPPYLPAAEDSYKFTVMSYNVSPEYSARPDSYMLYDVAALQYRFGANMATRSGDTSYATVSGPPDVIWDGGGNDTIDGSAYAFAQYLDLRPGAFSTLGSATLADTMAIAFGAIIENAFGGLGNDTLVGSGGANRLVGNAGNDTLAGGLGNDTIDGGAGADSMTGGDGVDTLSYASSVSGAGILFYMLAANLNGGDAAGDIYSLFENVAGTSANDRIYMDNGANSVEGGGGFDTVELYGGNDSYTGGSGFDYVLGGAGADLISVGAGGSLIYGEADNDTIIASSGSNSLYGGGGNDTIQGGINQDVIFGGDGLDVVTAFDGDDFVFGEDGNDDISGNAGNDQIQGGLGLDSLFGNAGVDIILGGADADSIDGGSEGDFLFGEAGNDTVLGGAGNDQVFGGSENDSVVGNAGIDILNGGDGSDTLNDGGTGELTFSIGGNGNDTIIGTSGQDQMWGGTGAIDTGSDVFQFGAGNGFDIIFDFQAGAGVVDQIRLIGFGLSNFGQMLSANLISQAGANTQINLPGAGNVIFLMNTTATTLVADDFLFG